MIKYKFQWDSDPREITAIRFKNTKDEGPDAPVRDIKFIYRKGNDGVLRLLWLLDSNE